MRILIGIVLPLLIHAIGYALVFMASAKTGSFVGLLAISAIVVTVPILLLASFVLNRGKASLKRLALATWTIAIVPPALLLVLNELVT